MEEADVRFAWPDGPGHDARDDVRRPRRVVEAPTGFGGERPVGGEARHVAAAVSEEHGDDVGHPVVDIVLDEVEPVAHGEQLAQGDGVTRVGGVGPFGNEDRRVEVEPPVPDEDADGGVKHRLRHRPAEQRGLGRDRRGGRIEVLERAGVALEDESAPVDHGEGEGDGQRTFVVEGLRQRPADVDPRREVARRPPLGRPGHPVGLNRQGWERPARPAHPAGRITPRRRGMPAGPGSSPPAVPAEPSARRPRPRSCRGSRATPQPSPRWPRASSAGRGRARR